MNEILRQATVNVSKYLYDMHILVSQQSRFTKPNIFWTNRKQLFFFPLSRRNGGAFCCRAGQNVSFMDSYRGLDMHCRWFDILRQIATRSTCASSTPTRWSLHLFTHNRVHFRWSRGRYCAVIAFEWTRRLLPSTSRSRSLKNDKFGTSIRRNGQYLVILQWPW